MSKYFTKITVSEIDDNYTLGIDNRGFSLFVQFYATESEYIAYIFNFDTEDEANSARETLKSTKLADNLNLIEFMQKMHPVLVDSICRIKWHELTSMVQLFLTIEPGERTKLITSLERLSWKTSNELAKHLNEGTIKITKPELPPELEELIIETGVIDDPTEHKRLREIRSVFRPFYEFHMSKLFYSMVNIVLNPKEFRHGDNFDEQLEKTYFSLEFDKHSRLFRTSKMNKTQKALNNFCTIMVFHCNNEPVNRPDHEYLNYLNPEYKALIDKALTGKSFHIKRTIVGATLNSYDVFYLEFLHDLSDVDIPKGNFAMLESDSMSLEKERKFLDVVCGKDYDGIRGRFKNNCIVSVPDFSFIQNMKAAVYTVQ